MEVVSLAQVSDFWWIVTLEESEQGWDVKQFKPAKADKLKSLKRARESAKSRGLRLVEIDFSKEQMEAIASSVQEAIDRKEQRRLEKERRKHELRQHLDMQDTKEVAVSPPPQTPQPQQPATPKKPQALLEEIQHLKQQLAKAQRERDELEKEVNQLNKKNGELKKQVSHLQEEVRNLSLRLTKE